MLAWQVKPSCSLMWFNVLAAVVSQVAGEIVAQLTQMQLATQGHDSDLVRKRSLSEVCCITVSPCNARNIMCELMNTAHAFSHIGCKFRVLQCTNRQIRQQC